MNEKGESSAPAAQWEVHTLQAPVLRGVVISTLSPPSVPHLGSCCRRSAGEIIIVTSCQ